MTTMNHTHLAPYRRLADDLEAATNRRDELGADAIRDLLPELRDAVDAMNAAMHEADELLFEGLRDEALGLHDPDLFVVAMRLNLQSRPQWPDIQAWLAASDIVELPLLDTDAMANIEVAHGEMDSVNKGIHRLRRMALERASIAQKITVLRYMRSKDPTKRVWITNLTTHEDMRLRELRAAIQRSLQQADFDLLAELHAELVAPEWEAKIPRELVNASRGADVAATLRGIALRAEALAQNIEARYAASSEPTHLHCEELVALRQRFEECAPAAEECLSQLRDCPQVLAIVTKMGLHSVIETIYTRLAPAFEWIFACENLYITRATFSNECCRLEYLCDHMPDKNSESEWLAGVQRSEAEVRRCCQQLADLVFPELLQERLRKSTASIKSGEELRLRFVIISAVAGVLLLVSMTGFFGWQYWRRVEYDQAIVFLTEAVHNACLGGYLDRPDEVTRYAEAYPTDTRVLQLLPEFDAYVVAENKRRNNFGKLTVEHKESLEEAVNKDLAERKDFGNKDLRLAAWPESFVEAAEKLLEAKKVGGLQSKRGRADSEYALPPSSQAQLEQEDLEIADRESELQKADSAFDDLAVKAFDDLRDAIKDRIPQDSDADAQAVAKTLLGELRALRTKANSKKHDKLPKTTRVPKANVDSLMSLEERLILKSKAPRL